MRSILLLTGAMCLAATVATPAHARCAGQIRDVKHTIPAGEADNGRSFTVDGCAKLIVRRARLRNGDKAMLTLAVQGYCDPRVGSYVECKVRTNYAQEVFARIENDDELPVTYYWTCRHC